MKNERMNVIAVHASTEDSKTVLLKVSILALSLRWHQGRSPSCPLLGYSPVVSLAPPVTMSLCFIVAARHTKAAEVASRQEVLRCYV